MAPLRIAIVGYGIAGIASAILLRRLGHRIDHFERASRPSAAGAGLLLHAGALRALDALGLREAVLARTAPVTRVRAESADGRTIFEARYGDAPGGEPGRGIQRAALLDALRRADVDADRLQTSRDIVSCEPESGFLVEADGRRHGPFDLIVAADGAGSKLRRSAPLLLRRDAPSPWAAVVCLLDDPGGLGGDTLRQTFVGSAHVAIWPVGPQRPGNPPRLNVAINVAPQELGALLEAGRWRRRAAALCPSLAPLLGPGSIEPIGYAYRDVELSRYWHRRLVLVGDAAHSMSPQLGQGASMALQDAVALAEALQGEAAVDAALAAFDRRRRGHIVAYQRLSRWATPALQSDRPWWRAFRGHLLGPLSRLPAARATMLDVMAGHDLRRVGNDADPLAFNRSERTRSRPAGG